MKRGKVKKDEESSMGQPYVTRTKEEDDPNLGTCCHGNVTRKGIFFNFPKIKGVGGIYNKS